MAQHCPRCGKDLRPIMQDGKRGVCCADPLCLFNFEDQSCPTCGKPPARAEHPELGRYECTCPDGHKWSVL